MALRTTETGLYVAVIVAVLAFGGAAPPFFLLTQLLIFGLAILLLCANLRSAPGSIRLPRTVPIVLIALVLLQILPLRAPMAVLDITRGVVPGGPSLVLSLAPYQTVSHLLLLLTYLTAFYLALFVCQDRNAKRRLVYALVALGIFEACYGLVQYLTGWQQIFAYVKKYYLEDATGTYINRNHFAGLLEMVLPFAVAFALHLAGTIRRDALGSEQPLHTVLSARLPPLVFWLFTATIISAALIFSRSRMGMISALASLLTILLLARGPLLTPRMRYLVAALIVGAVAALLLWIGSEPVVTRFETLEQEYGQSAQSRLSIWRDTLHLIGRYPLLGTGLGTFSVAYPSVQTAFLDLRVEHAHCDYLEVASDLGLPGGILVFGSVLWILARTARLFRRAADPYDSAISLGCIGSTVAILVHSLVDFNLYIPANALVLCVVLALARCTTQGTVSSDPAELVEKPRTPANSDENRRVISSIQTP